MSQRCPNSLTPPAGWEAPEPEVYPARPVTFAKSPSDHRGDKNSIGRLRRQGLKI